MLKDGTYLDNDNNGKTNLGDSVTYTFVVSNTGNVDLTNITVADNNAVITGGPIALLKAGQTDSKTFTAVHIITQADIDTGYVYNTALATGQGPSHAFSGERGTRFGSLGPFVSKGPFAVCHCNNSWP